MYQVSLWKYEKQNLGDRSLSKISCKTQFYWNSIRELNNCKNLTERWFDICKCYKKMMKNNNFIKKTKKRIAMNEITAMNSYIIQIIVSLK